MGWWVSELTWNNISEPPAQHEGCCWPTSWDTINQLPGIHHGSPWDKCFCFFYWKFYKGHLLLCICSVFSIWVKSLISSPTFGIIFFCQSPWQMLPPPRGISLPFQLDMISSNSSSSCSSPSSSSSSYSISFSPISSYLILTAITVHLSLDYGSYHIWLYNLVPLSCLYNELWEFWRSVS